MALAFRVDVRQVFGDLGGVGVEVFDPGVDCRRKCDEGKGERPKAP